MWEHQAIPARPTGSSGGQSHAELAAELNNEYAVEYLVLGAMLGLTGRVGSLWVWRESQVTALSVAICGAVAASYLVSDVTAFRQSVLASPIHFFP